MSPNDVLTFFKSLVDDEPDATMLAVLADTAYTKRNASRYWSFLLALDTSITQGSTDTWLTTHNLPSDFDDVFRVFGGAGGQNEYHPIPFEDILNWISAQNHYTIDYANSQIRFTGGAQRTIYMWYRKLPTSLIGLSDAQKTSSTTILWPKQFCPLLAYDMAEMYFGGIDADMVSRSMAGYQANAKVALENAFITWDNRRRMKMFDNAATPLHRDNGMTPADVVDIPD